MPLAPRAARRGLSFPSITGRLSLSRRQNKFETAPPLDLNRPGPNFPNTHPATPESRHQPSVDTGTGPRVAAHHRAHGDKRPQKPWPHQVNPADPVPDSGTSLPGSAATAPVDWLQNAGLPGAGTKNQPMTSEEGGPWQSREVLRGQNAPCSRGGP